MALTTVAAFLLIFGRATQAPTELYGATALPHVRTLSLTRCENHQQQERAAGPTCCQKGSLRKSERRVASENDFQSFRVILPDLAQQCLARPRAAVCRSVTKEGQRGSKCGRREGRWGWGHWRARSFLRADTHTWGAREVNLRERCAICRRLSDLIERAR